MTTETQVQKTDVSDVQQELKETIPAGYWKNAKGTLTPLSKITDAEKLNEKFVRHWVKEGRKRRDENIEFKMGLLEGMDDLLDELLNIYGVKKPRALTHGKGNISFISYAGDLKIERSFQESIGFDERLNLSVEMIRECAARWKRGSNQNLAILAEAAVEPTSSGQLSISRLLDLRRKNIPDDDWRKAMELLGDSMRTVASKMQVRMYERDEQGKWQPIPLNMSAI